MTVLARPSDIVSRDPMTVMFASCADELREIQRLWPWFEERVGLRGRKMYAAADVSANEYWTCTPIRLTDDPQALGIEVGQMAGGLFRRGRLRGEPPELYSDIAPGFVELEAVNGVDPGRPLIEYYKRHDEIELWLPIPAA